VRAQAPTFQHDGRTKAGRAERAAWREEQDRINPSKAKPALPAPVHRAIVVPVCELACTCGERFRTRTGQADHAKAASHVRAARRKQLDEFHNGERRRTAAEAHARARRRRLADIPEAGCRTLYLAELWNIAKPTAYDWLMRAARDGKVTVDWQKGARWWRRTS
jgi:hypothetical protein